MTGDSHGRLSEIFLEVCDLPSHERDAVLDAACGGDGELRREVEAMLAAEEQRGNFLEGRAPAPEAFGDAGPEGTDDAAEVLGRLAGRGTAGRYEPRGEVARGGQGTVLRVWDQDLRRFLAMKVVHDGSLGVRPAREVDSRTLGRFLDEAQITGQLDHPGIVPVHELGLDSQGNCYFTMKLVKGQTLTGVFDQVARGEERWTRTRALGVLLKVCEAMAYAHSKQVIHRDLKPSNIMVGDFGEVYVMDWGVARVRGVEDRHDVRLRERVPEGTRPELAVGDESPLLTMEGDVVGTPAYMSPEQARGEVNAMGPTSDVYSLGAILYHLCAGHAPYTESEPSRSPWAILGRVRDRAPAPIGTLAVDLPEELVAICERAMQRDPAQRYTDTSSMAEDLAAFLEGRVVRAHRTGAWVELVKWTWRNRGLAASLAAAVLALAVGLAAAGVLQRRADASARTVGAINAFLVEDLLSAAAPSDDAGRGREVTVREVLDTAAERIDMASAPGGRFSDQPGVEAAIRTTLGKTYYSLGLPGAALPHLERAVALEERLAGPEVVAGMSCFDFLARTLGDLGDGERAVQLLERQVEHLVRRDGPDSQPALYAKTNLAGVHALHGRLDRASELYAEVLESSRRTRGEGGELTSKARMNLAMTYRELGQTDLAVALFEQVAAGWSSHGVVDTDTAVFLEELGKVRCTQGRFDEANALFEEVLALRAEVLGTGHPETLSVVSSLAVSFMLAGCMDEALPLLEEVLVGRERVLPQGSPEVSLARLNLGIVHGRLRHWTDAEPLLLDCFDEVVDLGLAHLSRRRVLDAVAWMFEQTGREAEALPLRRELLAWQLAGAQGNDATADEQLAAARLLVETPHAELADPALALELATHALSGERELAPGDLDVLARVQFASGERVAAAATQRRALEALPAEDPDRPEYEARLARYQTP